MLYTTNEDRPGMIGAIGKILGDAGVNIATFHLGRAERGAEAIALLEIDEPISPEVLKKVRAVPHLKQAAALRF
jgi:D-3-phosphoglycerate dehydrogenase